MNIQKVQIRNRAVMTCYLMATSLEMPNLNVRPAVLVLPGGGYRYCSDREAEPIALAYMQQGYNAFVLNYTLRGQVADEAVFPEALADATEALEYIRSHAEELRVDPKRIAAVGFSAGGNLAAALGTMGEERPDVLVLGYAVLDETVREQLHLTAPVMYDQVDGQTPPAFLFATQGDSVVNPLNTLRFASALALAKVPYEVHIFAVGEHGQSLGNEIVSNANGGLNEDVAQWVIMSVRFMNHLWSGIPLAVTRKDRNLAFSADLKLTTLTTDGRSVGLFEQHFPGLRDEMNNGPVEAELTLREFAEKHPEKISPERLESMDQALRGLNR